jgi:cell division protein FtsQ
MIALAIVLVVVVLGGGYLWVRDSSLVAVRTVTVVGVSGKDARRIRRALTAAAKTMTTLDVNMAALRTAVAPYSEIKAIHVTTQFPHGMRIDVVENYPLAMVSAGGQEVAVAPDGTLLHDVSGSGALPTIPVGVPPGGNRLTAHGALDALAVLAAAPYQFIPRISQANENSTHGVVIQLRSGPAVYFGDTGRLDAKWHALVLVLADPGSAGATYIDVSDPQPPRPRSRPASRRPAPRRARRRRSRAAHRPEPRRARRP